MVDEVDGEYILMGRSFGDGEFKEGCDTSESNDEEKSMIPKEISGKGASSSGATTNVRLKQTNAVWWTPWICEKRSVQEPEAQSWSDGSSGNPLDAP